MALVAVNQQRMAVALEVVVILRKPIPQCLERSIWPSDSVALVLQQVLVELEV
ncbi:hypothetical protein [Bradyrhizobium sp.]